MRVIGLMSGTSLDGVDAAVVEIATRERTLEVTLAGWTETAWPVELRDRVAGWSAPEARVAPGELSAASMAVGTLFADAAEQAARAAGLSLAEVDLMASHGQTIHHNVDASGVARSTLQIGEPAVIAEQTGRTVVAHFRPRDIAAGGQGAPLVGFFDVLAFADPDRTVAALNLGGMANVTVIPAGDRDAAIAFDTGPANALIDGVARRLLGAPLDRDGAAAAAGTACDPIVEEILADPWFALPPPRSTGRERFGDATVDRLVAAGRARGLDATDISATATEVTARSVADAIVHWSPSWPAVVHVSGGGTRNRALMRALDRSLRRVAPPGAEPPDLRDIESAGVPAAVKEAVCFAVLGHEALHGRPNSLPGATGARHPSVLGAIWPGENYLPLLDAVRASGTTARRIDRIVLTRSDGGSTGGVRR